MKPNAHPLDPDAIRARLAGHPWADRIVVLDTVDSTNRYLKQKASDGAQHGTVVIAEQQTAGRGRMGRSFLSAPGVGIYLSMLLRPNCPPTSLLPLTAQAAVAVRRAILSACGVRPDVKWVNDLLLGGKKICGILTELSVEAGSGRVDYAVVGVGVNCNQSDEDFPVELHGIAGSICSQTGLFVDRDELAADLIRELSRLPMHDWRDEYQKACVTLGREIRILSPSGETPATALDVDEQGALIVRYPDGRVGKVESGEVSVRNREIRPCFS